MSNDNSNKNRGISVVITNALKTNLVWNEAEIVLELLNVVNHDSLVVM